MLLNPVILLTNLNILSYLLGCLLKETILNDIQIDTDEIICNPALL